MRFSPFWLKTRIPESMVGGYNIRDCTWEGEEKEGRAEGRWRGRMEEKESRSGKLVDDRWRERELVGAAASLLSAVPP